MVLTLEQVCLLLDTLYSDGNTRANDIVRLLELDCAGCRFTHFKTDGARARDTLRLLQTATDYWGGDEMYASLVSKLTNTSISGNQLRDVLNRFGVEAVMPRYALDPPRWSFIVSGVLKEHNKICGAERTRFQALQRERQQSLWGRIRKRRFGALYNGYVQLPGEASKFAPIFGDFSIGEVAPALLTKSDGLLAYHNQDLTRGILVFNKDRVFATQQGEPCLATFKHATKCKNHLVYYWKEGAGFSVRLNGVDHGLADLYKEYVRLYTKLVPAHARKSLPHV